MSQTFKSQALEANLEQTRYKDIFIPEEHRQFIGLSAKYFGINKNVFFVCSVEAKIVVFLQNHKICCDNIVINNL